MHRFSRGSDEGVRRHQSICVERMEPRVFLSAVVHSGVHHAVKKPAKPVPVTAHAPILVQQSPVSKSKKKNGKSAAEPSVSGSTTPYGITPTQMAGAYLGTNFNFFGVSGDGTGQTIAIVAAYDDPGLISSTASNFGTSDLAMFDTYFHLPNPPSFTKEFASTAGTVTTISPGQGGSPYSQTGVFDWEIEESLDVEWAHAMAPNAKIVLIETVSNLFLLSGVKLADSTAGVDVVSMSWDQDESTIGSESADNSTYFNNSGITYLGAAGDYGAYGGQPNGETSTIAPQFPATSQYVVAVGGTTLSVSGTSWSSETTWGNGTNSGLSGTSGGGGGGGTSISISKPAYQTALLGAGGNREYPDISLDGNDNTGVPVYDTYDFGKTTPWVYGTVGGTSLATPLMAGLPSTATGWAVEPMSTACCIPWRVTAPVTPLISTISPAAAQQAPREPRLRATVLKPAMTWPADWVHRLPGISSSTCLKSPAHWRSINRRSPAFISSPTPTVPTRMRG